MAQRKPDPPAAAAPPPPAHDDLFDGPAEGRQPGDDQEEVQKPPAPKSAALQAEVATTVEPRTAITKRSLFGGEEMQVSVESGAVEAQVRARIAARTLHALQHPRTEADARIRIMNDCKRPEFAKAALYSKPVGGQKIEGLSIRFAETALRHWGNVASDSIVLSDTDRKRLVNVTVTDLETNVSHGRDIPLMKTVERRTLKPGQVAIAQRINSYGDTVYVVEATEDELATKESAQRSKILRNEGLRLIPADILDEAKLLCKATRGKSDADNPTAARNEITDLFAEIGVMPSRLEEYLQHPFSETSPAELGDLREMYRAIRDGDATLAEFIEARMNDAAPAAEGEEKPSGSAVEAIKAKAKAKQAERKAQKK